MGELNDEKKSELLALTKSADSVELKLSVKEDEYAAASLALGLDPIKAEIRQVYFFDTPDLDLDAAGVVVRARRIQRDEADTVIKLRPVIPDELPDEMRKSDSMKVEVDLMPGRFVTSASMKGNSTPDEVADAVAGKRDIKDLFSKVQKAFFDTCAPQGIKLDELVPLGPILTLKLKYKEQTLDRELVTELWLYPDGSRILELSTKCEPDETFQVAAETSSFLAGKGIDLEGEQRTKTKTALEYFSKNAR